MGSSGTASAAAGVGSGCALATVSASGVSQWLLTQPTLRCSTGPAVLPSRNRSVIRADAPPYFCSLRSVGSTALHRAGLEESDEAFSGRKAPAASQGCWGACGNRWELVMAERPRWPAVLARGWRSRPVVVRVAAVLLGLFGLLLVLVEAEQETLTPRSW
jgi:hypothetical protein